MDPNNSQPIGTSPVGQPTPQPVQPTEAAPAAPTPAPTISPEGPPKGKSSKAVILLVILLLLVVGMVSYVLFAKNQMNKTQKATTDNSSTVLPTPTLVPTLAPEEDLEAASPEGDLLELDADVKGL